MAEFDLSAFDEQPQEKPEQPSGFDLSAFGGPGGGGDTLDAIGISARNALTDVFVDDPIQFFGNRGLQAIASDPVDFSLEGALETVGNPFGAGLAEAVRLANQASSGALQKFLGEEVQEAQARTEERNLELAEAVGDSVGNEIAAGAVGSATRMIPALAAGFINPMAGLGMIGFTSLSSAENRALRQGYNQNEARLYGAMSGVIEAGTEAIPLGILLKRLPFKKKLAKFMLTEIPSELAATTLDKLAAWTALGEDFTGQELMTDLAMTAAITPLAAGLQVGTVQPINRAIDIKQRWDVQKETMRNQGLQSKVQEQRMAMVDELVDELVREESMVEGQKLVWHGTPEGLDIDRGFDSDYIDSPWYDNERGDAWGHYFSDSPVYSKGYMADQSTEAFGGVLRGLPEGFDPQVAESLALGAAQEGATIESSIQEAVQLAAARRDQAAREGDLGNQLTQEVLLNQLQGLDPTSLSLEEGNLYSVALSNTETFMNWGRNLSGQRPEVQQILRDAGMQENETGQDFYRRIQRENDFSGREVSEWLDEKGVPGVVYDRVFADGRHKVYTVFSDANPSIIEMNTAKTERLAADLKDFQQRQAMEELAKNPPELTMQEKMTALGKAVGLSREQMFAQMEENIKFDFFRRWTMGLEQMADNNPGNEGLQNYRGLTRAWNQEHGKWVSEANEVIHDWDGITKNREVIDQQMDALVDEVDKVSRAQQKRLTPEEVKQIAERKGLTELTDTHLEILDRMWNHYARAIDESILALENVVRWRTPETEAKEETVAEIMRPVRQQAENLRNRNFVPHYRYGSWEVNVKENPSDTARLYSRSFPNEKQARAAIAEIRKDHPGKHVQLDRNLATRRQGRRTGFSGINDRFIDALYTQLELDLEQQENLDIILEEYQPEAAFLNRMETADDIPGWSTNSLRGYATFMSQFANRIGKLKYDHQLDREIKRVETTGTQINPDGTDSTPDSVVTKRTELAEWLRNHRHYMGNPQNEFTDLRAMGFMWYLGFVPKAAAVNLTQVPLVAYPYLASKHGDVAAVSALTKAQGRFFKNFRNEGNYSEGEQQMLAELRRTILEENQAQELGAISAGDNLMRLTQGRIAAGPRGRRAVRKFSEAGAFMFQKAENYNRQIVALAAYDLAIRKGDTHGQAVEKAREAVIRTQFEYARYNRPELMRGKKSALFLFMNYLTSMMWLVFGNNPAKWRMLAMMLFAGGLQGGIPGAENIADLIDGAMTKIGKRAGWKNPKMQVREELRHFIEGLVEEPDTFAGEAARLVGLSPQEFSNYIMNGVGADIGGVDISGSLSFGRVIPGTEMFSREVDTERAIAEGVRGVGGALGNIPYGILQAAFGNEMDSWRAWEKAMPTSMRNISRAARWAARGEETDRSLRQIAAFDPEDDWAMIGSQALGFPPSEINQKQERTFAANDAIQFYRGYRTAAMGAYWKAMQFDEPKGPALELIKRYNRQVPFPEMKIGAEDIRRSILQRAKESGYREAGTLQEKRYRRLYDEVLGPFATPIGTEESP